jgi:hypothetical protein
MKLLDWNGLQAGCAYGETPAPCSRHGNRGYVDQLQEWRDFSDAHLVGRNAGGCLMLEPLEAGSRLSQWCRRSVSLLARQAQFGNLRTTKPIGAGT